jgi:hypothetical protein
MWTALLTAEQHADKQFVKKLPLSYPASLFPENNAYLPISNCQKIRKQPQPSFLPHWPSMGWWNSCRMMPS